jgi:predicted RecA/RadA family phage recombinase
MTRRIIAPGRVVKITAPTNLKVDAIFKQGQILGTVTGDVLAGQEAEIATEGIFLLPYSGSATDTAGTAVNFNGTSGKFDAADDGKDGFLVRAFADGNALIKLVKIGGGAGVSFATQDEVNAGTVDNKAVSPKTLKKNIGKIFGFGVKSLLHFDNDLSDQGNYFTSPWSSLGGVMFVSDGKFGSCIHFSNSIVYSFGAYPSKSLFASGYDFTIECFFKQRSRSAPATQTIFATFWNQSGLRLQCDYGGTIGTINVGIYPTAAVHQVTGHDLLGDGDTWHHIGIERYSGVFKVFLDGSVIDEFSGSPQNDSASELLFVIGNTTESVTGALANANVDEFCFTQGYAKYQDGYTVPTAPFTIDD